MQDRRGDKHRQRAVDPGGEEVGQWGERRDDGGGRGSGMMGGKGRVGRWRGVGRVEDGGWERRVG